MHKIASEKEPDAFKGIFIAADGNRSPPPTRTYVQEKMVEIPIPVSITNSMVPYLIANLLQCDTSVEIANFYDRDPQVSEWYYQAYVSNRGRRTNSIANVVTQDYQSNALGDLFIIKSGPENGIWKWDPDLTIKQTAETLWWYQQSGRDMRTVFNERGLVRLLGNMTQFQ